jgi:hypothetical protein
MPFWRFTTGASHTNKDTTAAPPSKRRQVTKSKPKPRSNKSKPNRKQPTNPPLSRWNPSILPTSPKFLAALAEFSTLLRSDSHTITSILSAKFTRHERAVLTPCNPKTNPTLAAIQAANKARYTALLRSDRFKEFQGRADLAFKFTLAWFGLPVAAMGVESVAQWKGWGDESEGEWDDDEEVVEEGGLRWLNEYGERGFGRDVEKRELFSYLGCGMLC